MIPRADRAHRLTDRELKNLEEKIAKAYKQAYDGIAEKTDKYFIQFAKRDKEMAQKVKDKKITVSQYREWRKNKMLIGQRWNNMLEVIGKDMLNTEKIAMSYVNDTKLDVYAINANFATYQIEHDSRIDTSFTLYNKDTVKMLIKENPRLLPNYKPNEEKLLLWNKQHINSAITQAILQGKAIPDVAKSLEKVTDMDKRAAVRNARTAVTCAQNKARFDSYERAEELGIKMKKVWIATLDDRTRESHVDLDGEEVDINEKFSNGLMFPADPDGEPAEAYNCRCRMITQIDKYRTDWSDLKNRNNDKLGGMSYDEWKETHGVKVKPKEKPKGTETPKENKPIIHTEAYKTLIDKIAKDYNIEYREVEDLQKSLTEEQIIEKIGGGDLTKGSCSSLSYCYIGDKCGYDVTDFRGGDSQEFFSLRRTEKIINSLDGVEKQTFIVNKEASDVAKKLKELDLPYGKEYRLTCGRHAAIIRNTENGYEYLELQSATRNGWKSFTEKERLKVKGVTDGKFEYETIKEKCSMADTLKNRFGCRVSKSNNPIWDEASGGVLKDENGLLVFGSEMELTSVDSYKGNQEFKDILGYINTASDKQQKGDKGYAK